MILCQDDQTIEIRLALDSISDAETCLRKAIAAGTSYGYKSLVLDAMENVRMALSAIERSHAFATILMEVVE